MGPASTPDWVRDGLRKAWEEIALFFATAAQITRRPATFAREWDAGTRHALNPFGFLATSVAITGPIEHVTHLLTHREESGTLRDELWQALDPYVTYLLIGVVAHWVFRLWGSRQPLRATLGIALYAGGGPAAAITLLVAPFEVALWRLMPARQDIHSLAQLPRGFLPVALATGLFSIASIVVFIVVFARALSGLHERRWYASLVALTAGWIAMSMVTSALSALHTRRWYATLIAVALGFSALGATAYVRSLVGARDTVGDEFVPPQPQPASH